MSSTCALGIVLGWGSAESSILVNSDLVEQRNVSLRGSVVVRGDLLQVQRKLSRNLTTIDRPPRQFP
jgi:hypothetical protein